MKFRRKSAPESAPAEAGETTAPSEQAPAPQPGEVPASGPHDVTTAPQGVERIDLGSLLLPPTPGREVRLQVNEATDEVGAVLLVAEDGAVELQAFSAARSGGLWEEVRPQIIADIRRRGGDCQEREGRFGPELLCRVPAKLPDGSAGVQVTRIIGVDGPRWMLRATLLGRPALEPDQAGEWEDVIADVVVRRGEGAMPVGRPLPFVLPPGARRSG